MVITLFFRLYYWILSNRKEILYNLIICSFLVLFAVTAYDKLTTFKSFNTVLSRSVLIGSLSLFVASFVILSEIAITIFLCFPKSQKKALHVSLALLVVFTLYLTYMVITGDKTTCHCGGVISSLTWTQHIFFNLGFIVLALIGIKLNKK